MNFNIKEELKFYNFTRENTRENQSSAGKSGTMLYRAKLLFWITSSEVEGEGTENISVQVILGAVATALAITLILI